MDAKVAANYVHGRENRRKSRLREKLSTCNDHHESNFVWQRHACLQRLLQHVRRIVLWDILGFILTPKWSVDACFVEFQGVKGSLQPLTFESSISLLKVELMSLDSEVVRDRLIVFVCRRLSFPDD